METISLRQWIAPIILGILLLSATLWIDHSDLMQRLISLTLTMCTLIGLLVAVFVLCFTLLVLLELFGKWLWRVGQRVFVKEK